MEVRKLYYEDSHLWEFTATVTGCVLAEKGWLVTLDATAFYPEGGGQACDTGRLQDAQVLDVQEEDGQILHLCDQSLQLGQRVTGRVDRDRRFDLMQQHTGEHIVSGIINQRFGYHNVGFHMGADLVTIDFDGMLHSDDLAVIEKEANEAIWRNIEVRCWYPTQEELPNVGYRSKKELPWPVRVVEVPGYDKCACCGVHVQRTGEIGLIKLFSCVKFHQGVRIEMACGGRALNFLSRVYEQNRQVSQAFSAKVLETGEAARRINEQLAAEKFRAASLEKQVFDAIAQGYTDCGNVVRFEDGLQGASLRELSDRIAQKCGGTAAVFSGSDADGYNLCLVNKTEDVKALGNALSESFGGRGGGKPGFFQGSIRGDKAGITAFFAQYWQ